MPISAGRALGPAGHYKMALVPSMGWQFGPMVRHDPTRKHIGLDSVGPSRAGPNRARVGRFGHLYPHHITTSYRFVSAGRTCHASSWAVVADSPAHHPSRDACIYRQCRAASHPESWLLDLLLAEHVADIYPCQPAGQSLSLRASQQSSLELVKLIF
jgi:hypothetical protein